MVAAVSMPNESEEQNIPKKEVTHHLPPGAYPVYPQFMGLYIIYLSSQNFKHHKYRVKHFVYVFHLYKNFALCIFFKVIFTLL